MFFFIFFWDFSFLAFFSHANINHQQADTRPRHQEAVLVERVASVRDSFCKADATGTIEHGKSKSHPLTWHTALLLPCFCNFCMWHQHSALLCSQSRKKHRTAQTWFYNILMHHTGFPMQTLITSFSSFFQGSPFQLL